VCADGPQSVGRRLLFPAQSLQYVGYILWRGLAAEQAVTNIALLEERVTWAVSETGYCLLYLVPSRAEEVAVGKRQVNWVLYENVAEAALPGVLTGAQGVATPPRCRQAWRRRRRWRTSTTERASTFPGMSPTSCVPHRTPSSKPSLTRHWSRRPHASAPPSLSLLSMAEAQCEIAGGVVGFQRRTLVMQ
jgi:hypothetical protein